MGAHNGIVTRYSRQRDEVAASLEMAFPRVTDVRFPEAEDGIRHANMRLSLGDLTIARYASSGFGFSAVHSDSFHLGLATQGGLRLRTRQTEICLRPFAVGNTLAANQEFAMDVAPGSVVFTVDLSMSKLMQRAEYLIGRRVGEHAFDAAVMVEKGQGSVLLRNVVYAFSELQAMRGARFRDLAANAYAELLANLVLAAVHPEVREELALAPAALAPALADRACQMLAAHAHEAISIVDVAREMGVSVRALQVSFQRHVGCSPLQYLLRCRLELARGRLLSPAAADTVSTIALDCGFLNMGRFAERYRKAYGEPPSETLSRMRRMLGLCN